MKFLTLLLIFFVIVLLDKGITFANIKQTWKNFPESVKDDLYKAEKNPLAKWFFQKLGLTLGTVVYLVLAILTLFIGFFILQKAFGETTALFIIFMLYGLVIANNIFYLLRALRIIP